MSESKTKTLVPYGTCEVEIVRPSTKGLTPEGRVELRRIHQISWATWAKENQEVYMVLIPKDGTEPVAFDRQYSMVRRVTQDELADLMSGAYISQVWQDYNPQGFVGDSWWILHPDCPDAVRDRAHKSSDEESK